MTVVLVWGFNFSVMKLAYRSFHPIVFNAARFTIACVTMIFLLKLQRSTLHIDREDMKAVIWLGFLGNPLYQFFFALGLERTRAGNAGLLMALTPVFAYLIGILMKREKFSPGVLAGIILSLCGVAAIVLFSSAGISFTGTWRGDLMMIAAAFLWGWYSADSTKLLVKYGTLRLTVATIMTGSAMIVLLSIPWLLNQDWSSIDRTAWLCLAYSAFLSIVYGYFVWGYGLRKIGVSHTAVFSNVTPIIALIAGWWLLGEQPSPAQLIGVVLVVTGVFMVRSRKPFALPDE
jgi:drug/metabolite transporter (DMT)-like permease